MNEKLSCPLCHGNDLKTTLFIKEMRVLKCASCGMMFQDPVKMPLLKNEDFTESYAVNDEESLKLKTDIETGERLKYLTQFIGKDLKGKKILELGAGAGVLADLLIQSGADYRGIEPSSPMHELAIKNFPILKNHLQKTTFDHLNLEKDYFDAILMIDVFEHIPDPLNFLKKIKGCLKKEGILYIEVPNESFLKIKGFLRNKMRLYGGYPTHPSHVSLFTLKTLRKILDLSGMNRVSIFQLSVWGNRQRLELALKDRLPGWLCLASDFFNLTKLDLMLGQGNLIGVARKI